MLEKKTSQSHWLKEDFSGVESLKSRNRHEGLHLHFTLPHSGMRGCTAQAAMMWLLRLVAPMDAVPGTDAAWALTDAGCVTRDSWECLCLQPATPPQQMLWPLKVRSPLRCCPQGLYCPSGRQSECLAGVKNFLHVILTHCVFPITFDNETWLKHGDLLYSTWTSSNKQTF